LSFRVLHNITMKLTVSFAKMPETYFFTLTAFKYLYIVYITSKNCRKKKNQTIFGMWKGHI